MDEDGRDTSARPSQGQNHARTMLDEGIVFPNIPPPPKLDVANPTFEEG
jgi:hypothetical protein